MTSRFLKPIALLSLALTVGLPAVATADDKNPPSGERPPLREPRTPADRGTGKGGERPGAEGDKAKRERPAARPAGFLGLVAKVKELKLTDEQTKKVDAIVAEYEAGQKEWKEKNAAKSKELEDKAREEKKSGQVSDATKKAIEELNSTRPKADQFRNKLLEVLTAEERKELEAKMDADRKENREKSREDARKGREGRQGGKGDGKGTEGGNKDGNREGKPAR